jgi:integrase
VNRNGEHFTQCQVYGRIAALGKRADVRHAHPRRFRYTFAIEMLLRGSSAYTLAQLLGVNVQVVIKHFVSSLASFVRARLFQSNGTGLE